MANNFKISQVTLAANNIEKMAEFYSKVFKTELKSFEAMNSKFYSGNIAGISTMLCPNTIAGVTAEQNRHQFDYMVENLDEIIKNVLLSHGALKGEVSINENGKMATVIDPDGNTINFIEK